VFLVLVSNPFLTKKNNGENNNVVYWFLRAMYVYATPLRNICSNREPFCLIYLKYLYLTFYLHIPLEIVFLFFWAEL